LNINLSDHLNTGIAIKSIKNQEDCMDWITWSFFYRRLRNNPNYYNLQDVEDDGVSAHLSELIENTLEYMERVNCIEIEN
jgi:pre-mRNA-splicing helicase BRR2